MMFGSRTQSLMAPTGPKDGAGKRPSPLRPTRSFPRTEAHDASVAVNRTQRASTLQNGAATGAATTAAPPKAAGVAAVKTPPRQPHTQTAQQLASRTPDLPDTFEAAPAEDSPQPPRASIEMDDLPIELISLTDR